MKIVSVNIELDQHTFYLIELTFEMFLEFEAATMLVCQPQFATFHFSLIVS